MIGTLASVTKMQENLASSQFAQDRTVALPNEDYGIVRSERCGKTLSKTWHLGRQRVILATPCRRAPEPDHPLAVLLYPHGVGFPS